MLKTMFWQFREITKAKQCEDFVKILLIVA